MSIAFTYEIRGSDERTPVLIVVMVSTVVMPENIQRSTNHILAMVGVLFFLFGFIQDVSICQMVLVRK